MTRGNRCPVVQHHNTTGQAILGLSTNQRLGCRRSEQPQDQTADYPHAVCTPNSTHSLFRPVYIHLMCCCVFFNCQCIREWHGLQYHVRAPFPEARSLLQIFLRRHHLRTARFFRRVRLPQNRTACTQPQCGRPMLRCRGTAAQLVGQVGRSGKSTLGSVSPPLHTFEGDGDNPAVPGKGGRFSSVPDANPCGCTGGSRRGGGGQTKFSGC